jgi:hypothetical protein
MKRKSGFMRQPNSVNVKLNLHFLEISGMWKPNDSERKAAWELYVEIVTRIAAVPLNPESGLLREALTSLHSLFQTTRSILRRYGPAVAEPKPDGQYNFGFLAVALLNFQIRPLLSRWHPSLVDWEESRPIDRPRGEHERAWHGASALRAELAETRKLLMSYANTLAKACGVPDLTAAIPPDSQIIPSEAD